MKTFIALTMTAVMGWSLALPAAAQHHGHDAHHGVPAASAKGDAAAMLSEGIVRKVDKDAKKLTIKHGDLKTLGMGPMTMAFQVQDPAVLDKVNEGDKVTFVAEMVSGKLTASKVQVVK